MGIHRGLALLLFLTSAAQAEDAAVCRPYARLATDNVIREVWLRAYNYCMNMEVGGQPLPPDTWAGMLELFSPPAPVPRPVTPVTPGSVPASGGPDKKPAPVAPVVTAGPVGKSGFGKGTAQWVSWCNKNFPRSWDAKSQTVILPTSRKRVRTPCPG